ncbi:hypothetical protein KIH74_33800 [Kineosporia sp. J2-2]|uniref:Uncharacterized protein n=1 Tax=Kineosporia corallincola TaxID=2835133 RepID=A0ABS5TT57_9ACTN|nr:hypothetical protein [Kineosporia corallincola]MBT0773968.1 hypothetical protein [Kineosporia corallincola]
MPDLRDLMNEAADRIAVPSDSTVEADLVRGRRARARVARRRALVPAGLAAAGGVLAFALLGTGPAGTSTPPPTASLVLTSYQGAQPKGFTIDQVPTGWDVQALDESHLLLGPAGAADQDPDEYEGKILISRANELEESADRGDTHPLRVGDVTGTRFSFATDFVDGESVYGPDASPGLLVPERDGTLLFQFPDDLDWDDATIARFAAGVHLTGDAETAGG